MSDLSLGPHFDEFIESQIRSGRFRNASEVVRAGLQLLEDSEQGRAARLAKEINDAFDEPGEDVPSDEVFARLEAMSAVGAKVRHGGA